MSIWTRTERQSTVCGGTTLKHFADFMQTAEGDGLQELKAARHYSIVYPNLSALLLWSLWRARKTSIVSVILGFEPPPQEELQPGNQNLSSSSSGQE